MAMNQNEGTARLPSDFEIRYVNIYSSSIEEPLEISKLVNYVEVYESVYSPFLTVNINITDAQSLTSLLPLVGEEYIEIDIRGSDDTIGLIGQTFFIYKMSDRISVADRAVSYTLNCVSVGAIADMNIKLSQSFSGLSSDLVETIFCKRSLAIAKPIYSHPSKNNISYISNYWSPIQNIKFLCDRTVSSDNSAPSYLFFENKKQFNFVPLDTMVAQDSLFDFFYSVNTHSLSVSKEQGIIHKLYVDEGFNYIDRIMNGTYGNRTLVIDSSSKTYKYETYDFSEAFSKFNRLNQDALGTDSATRSLNQILRTRNIDSNTRTNMPDEFTSSWFKQRITELASITSSTVHIDVSGNMNINSGDVVNLIIPMTHITEQDSKDMSKIIDKGLSGRYLVTSMKHMFDRERHSMTLQLNKDSRVKI